MKYVRALVAALAISATGCGEMTGPPPLTLSISGPATASPRHGRYPDRTIRIECSVSLTAQAASSRADASAVWTGATLRWYRASTGALTTTHKMTTSELEEFWGSTQIRAGQTQTAERIFWDTEPFRLTVEFQYTTGGSTAGTATYELRCVPVAPGLSGRYILTTINDVRLPAKAANWDPVYADTLEFFPNNLTYTTRGRVRGAEIYDVKTGPEGYTVVAADTFSLPTIIAGSAGGRVVRSGTTLFFTQPGFGAGNYVWRFGLEGSNPQLPPLPSLVVTPDTLVFTATRGGALPAEQQFEIRSNSGEPIRDLTFGTSAFSPANVPNGMGITSGTTPSTIWVRLGTTDVAPGTYTMAVYVRSQRAANSPRVVTVLYRVSAP